MAILGDATINGWLTYLSGFTYQVSLHTSNPADNPVNPAASEISGGTYTRKTTGFTADLTNNKFSNSAIVAFDGLPAAYITHVGIWYTSGSSSGSMAFALPLSSPFTSTNGSTWSIAAGESSLLL